MAPPMAPPLPDSGMSSAPPPAAPPMPARTGTGNVPAAPPPPPVFAPPPSSGDSDQPAPVLSNDLLSSITQAGIGSLKRVDKSHLERPSVAAQARRDEPAAASNNPGDLAGALAEALSARKKKVTASDDEEADDDDWD